MEARQANSVSEAPIIFSHSSAKAICNVPRNVPDEVASQLLDRFEEVGLIDDEAFARSWVDSRQRTRGLARRALAQERRGGRTSRFQFRNNLRHIRDFRGGEELGRERAEVGDEVRQGVHRDAVGNSRRDTDAGCRQWQAAHPEAVCRWATTNQHYRTDMDTLDDIEALAASTGHRLCWPADLAVKS